MRFSEIQRALQDTNSVTLTNRLKRMAGAGLLKRFQATVNGQSVLYELSEMGEAFLPVLREMRKFANRFYAADDDAPRRALQPGNQ